MDYAQTLEYMFSQLPMFQRIGAAAYKANLDNTISLGNLTGNPHLKLKTIHVAGTNGKGSVSHMLASIMQENNLKTGLFSSPHLSDFRERIKVNGKMIDKKFVVDFVAEYKSEFKKLKPSFFEMTFALAMKWFEKCKTDIVIVETGMGGRLDSTNVILPLISVITNISLDHTRFLGDTIEAIAHEKAGIIKPGIPVVIGETNPESAAVFQKVAGSNHSPIVFADQTVNIIADLRHSNETIMEATAITPGLTLKLQSPMAGHYQTKNLATVLAAIDLLKNTYTEFEKISIGDGISKTIKNTGFKGRWQQLSKNPLTICDIAHNYDGITHIVNQLARMDYNRLHFVFGMVDDKNISGILNLLPGDATYYFCKADIPRGLDAVQLKTAAIEAGLRGECYDSVKKAYGAARKAAFEDDLIFVGGSTFVVAEII
ncbi:MAG: bifunctional folylpolyglutamate synthase/dihydrofolate synthase [Lentimicrobium sp.]|nr:bifunctional folylpolyglutamate synthase/dihydrofolate synthase [Lentimicrobium sp.]